VELLVAMSVFTLLVLMLSTVFDQVSRTWMRGEGQIEQRRNVRALADFIAVELQAAMLPIEGASKAGQSNLQFLINPPAKQVPAEYRYADTLFWQAPLATETSLGEIAEIGYFVKWVAATPDAPARPTLCRFFVNPSRENPEAPGEIIANPEFRIYDADPKAWLSKSLLDSVAPARKADGYTGLFGDNVIGLWVRATGLDGKELPRDYDSRTGYDYTHTYHDPSGAIGERTERRYLPATVRISLAQIDSRHAPRLDRVGTSLRALTRSPEIRDAAQFQEGCRLLAQSNASWAALLPGLRIYATEVQLINAR
jgi:uncharacterized protein (TIGR02599 family)